jgi:hypothetical protein
MLRTVCWLFASASFPIVPAGEWRLVWRVRFEGFERSRGFRKEFWKQKAILGDGVVVEKPAQLFQGSGFIEMNVNLTSETSVKAELFDIEGTICSRS